MSYLSLILALFSLVDKFTDWYLERKWTTEGERRQVAKAAVEIARKTGYANEVMAEFDAMPEPDVDEWLRRSEPGEPGDDRR